MIPETENPLEASVRVNLRGLLSLIRVDTLRRVHNVGLDGIYDKAEHFQSASMIRYLNPVNYRINPHLITKYLL